jgi:phosphoglycolate phosphatase
VQTTIYLGINELLASLRAQGFKLGVISNKAHRFTVPMTEHFFGMGTFDAVLGQRNEVPRKPAPDGAMEMATALGVPFASCAYVGDSGVDMKFGVNAGMRRIGVRWGFRSDEELLASGAEVLVSHPREILDFIQCC